MNPRYAVMEGFSKLSISWDEITLYRCLSGHLSRFSIFCIVHGFWSSGKFALKVHASYDAKITKNLTPWYILLDYLKDGLVIKKSGKTYQGGSVFSDN